MHDNGSSIVAVSRKPTWLSYKHCTGMIAICVAAYSTLTSTSVHSTEGGSKRNGVKGGGVTEGWQGMHEAAWS